MTAERAAHLLDLDRLVAEKVMGLKPCGPPLADWMYWDPHGFAVELPTYSSDISDAMLVLCKIRGPNQLWFKIEGELNHLYSCVIDVSGQSLFHNVRGDGETISEAICRAALAMLERLPS